MTSTRAVHRGEWDGAAGAETVQPPPQPPAFLASAASLPRVLIVGAGSRGRTYAEATAASGLGVVAAVVEPDAYKRADLGRKHIWGAQGRAGPAAGEAFADWPEFVAYERARRQRQADEAPPGVDAVFVCVQDEKHRAAVEALVALGGLHIMCEKPLATTLDDCVAMYAALRRSGIGGGGAPGGGAPPQTHCFAIGHVLRYSPHNRLLRRLVLEDRVVGDVLSVVHTEPVGWWHFTHSYVRGNWRRERTSAPSLLTKSCHDLDVLLWLLCSPPRYGDGDGDSEGEGEGEAATPPHLPSTVSSSGGLQLFRRSRKPAAAGAATNCLSCAAEPDCKYSAPRIYVGDRLRGLGTGNLRWPVSIIVPDIEECAAARPGRGDGDGDGDGDGAKAALLQALAEDYGPDTPDSAVAARNWFGRCVFESDNDVCDEQVVVVTWDEDPRPAVRANREAQQDPVADGLGHRGAKTATFHMVAHTSKICERYTHLYGVHGEIYADQATITVQDFRDGSTTVHRPPLESRGHGGGDVGLTRQFLLAVGRVKNDGWSAARAQRTVIGCTLEEMLRSHMLVFCAEAARRSKTVVDWAPWWAREVEQRLAGGGGDADDGDDADDADGQKPDMRGRGQHDAAEP